MRGQVDIRNVDVAAASAAGILVTQASRGFVAAVAEWIVGAMIAASRHTIHYSEAYRKGEEPAAIVGRQLAGSTIGIIGYGAIAEHLCGLAHAFGMRVLVTDPYKSVPAPFEPVDLATLLGQSDFVVPLAVANEETDDMIDAAALAQMQPHAWLINASRGNLIDEAALEAALDASRIAGACLDVGRAPDQKPSPHLARRPDVIASPHIGGLTPQALDHQALETVRQAGIRAARGDAHRRGQSRARHAAGVVPTERPRRCDAIQSPHAAPEGAARRHRHAHARLRGALSARALGGGEAAGSAGGGLSEGAGAPRHQPQRGGAALRLRHRQFLHARSHRRHGRQRARRGDRRRDPYPMRS